MDKDYLIKLTLAVYKVTEFFPKGEALKYDIRTLANEILANLIKNKNNNSQDIKILQHYFNLAETQNWVDSRNFSVLKREYDKIERLISAGKPVEKSFSEPNLRKRTKKRQKKILQILEKNKKIKVGDLIQLFPTINRRTLIRDLENCVLAGLVMKNGNGRGIYYTPKNVT